MPDDLITDSGSWKVFISYSWDSDEHKEWVLSLANRLRADGIDAILDQTHMQLGGRTPEFMEHSIRESRSVLVICTEGYKQRFDGRKGGAGYEGHIITADILGSTGTNKFIPVLRDGDWTTALPAALGGIYGVDLSSDSVEEYRNLVRHLHGINTVRPMGRPPDWLHETKPGVPATAPIPVSRKTPAVVATPQEYIGERKRLAESELVTKIWQMPHWWIWSRPLEFRKARFQNLDHCTQFVASANVRSHARWSQYPWFSTTPERGNESIVSGIEITDGSINHFEQWFLFQSGQFDHYLALDQIPQLGDRIHSADAFPAFQRQIAPDSLKDNKNPAALVTSLWFFEANGPSIPACGGGMSCIAFDFREQFRQLDCSGCCSGRGAFGGHSRRS